MYVVFPLIYALAKLQRKNAILVHSPLFFIYKLFLCTPLRIPEQVQSVFSVKS